MKIEYDPAKNALNIRTRGISFDCAYDFDWYTAVIIQDVRKDYSEDRFVAIGYLNCRLHVICFTPAKDGLRIISFRKANKREAKAYEKPLTIDE